MEYKDTLNLPKTDFPMKGNLPNREPEILKKWDDNAIYKKYLDNQKIKRNISFMMVLHMQTETYI